MWQLLNEGEKSQPCLSQTGERDDRNMKHKMAKACKSFRLDGSWENMQNLNTPLHKYIEPTGHEMENLTLKHPFTIKHFNNHEHYLCYETSVSSARSQALTVLTKSEHVPYTPGWTPRTWKNRYLHSKSTHRMLWSNPATDCQGGGRCDRAWLPPSWRAGSDRPSSSGAWTRSSQEVPSNPTHAGACICWKVN